MQDLNDKIKGNKLTASEWSEVASEIQNVITQSGQTLSSSDLSQLRKSLLIIDSITNNVPFTGTAIFETGEGIVFGGKAVTAANTLDDYEEGLWTPVISDGTNNATHNIQVASYEKIGRQVTYRYWVRASSLGSVTGATRITGLPYTSSSLSNNEQAGFVSVAEGLSITAGQNMGGVVNSNTDFIRLTLWDGTAGTSGLLASELTSSAGFQGGGTYHI